MLDIKRHPCFNVEVKGSCGRLHLPVAPKCNIMCNFCNRKYDCVNESRPGVTSTVLNPAQAEDYVRQVLEAEPRITVAGIAGPGDPFANPVETMETLRRIRKQFPDLLLCLASNGLNLPPYLDELADIGVSHVSITVNAIDPEIGRQIYSWIRDGKVIYRGLAGAELLLSRQLAAIEGLKARDIVVKVNTIVVPGINADHVPEIAAAMAARGVDILNCMPLYPNAETPFAGIPEPTPARIAEIQAEAGKFLPQMRHCTRCRADAVGLLEQDRTTELRSCLTSCAGKAPDVPDRPSAAVFCGSALSIIGGFDAIVPRNYRRALVGSAMPAVVFLGSVMTMYAKGYDDWTLPLLPGIMGISGFSLVAFSRRAFSDGSPNHRTEIEEVWRKRLIESFWKVLGVVALLMISVVVATRLVPDFISDTMCFLVPLLIGMTFLLSYILWLRFLYWREQRK